MTTYRIRFCAELELADQSNLDDDGGTRLEWVDVAAEVDSDPELSMEEAVTFLEPTLAELESLYGDRHVHALFEECILIAARVQWREREAAADQLALMAIAGGYAQ